MEVKSGMFIIFTSECIFQEEKYLNVPPEETTFKSILIVTMSLSKSHGHSPVCN